MKEPKFYLLRAEEAESFKIYDWADTLEEAKKKEEMHLGEIFEPYGVLIVEVKERKIIENGKAVDAKEAKNKPLFFALEPDEDHN